MGDDEVDSGAVPAANGRLAQRRPVPDWRYVHRELHRGRHVTLRLLWLEWRQGQPEGWGYTQFCVHYRAWLGTQDVVMRLDYPAGARMLVDYSGDTVPVVDPATGEISKAEVFVAVLGCSGMLFAEASSSQDLPSWLMAHVHAYEAYGGVAEATTPDYVARNIIGVLCPGGYVAERAGPTLKSA